MLDTLKKHWRVVTKSHIYTRVYNWEQFKKRYPFGLPDRSEDQFVVG